jgi:hypothetical protein
MLFYFLFCFCYVLKSGECIIILVKYLQPSVKELSTILPTPVIFAILNADNVAVMPREQDTKSAK